MQYFRGATAAEVIAVRVDAGEPLLETVNQVAQELQIAAGSVVSGFGVLEEFNLDAPVTTGWPPAVHAVTKQGPGQIVSLTGHVVSGTAELFATVVRRGEIYAGRVLEGCRVGHYVELTLLRVGNQRWVRVAPDPSVNNVPLLQATQPGAAAPGSEIRLLGQPIDLRASQLIPAQILRKHGVLPVAVTGDTLIVAMADPNNPFAIDDLRNAGKLRVQPVAVSAKELLPVLEQVLALRGA
jgi:predicted DNA-binding protein with PD1-like motif